MSRTDAPFAAAAGAGSRSPTRGHVLVTAATGALGPAARALAARGYAVTALARDRSALAELADGAGEWLLPVAADFADPALPDLLGGAEQVFGRFTGALLYCPSAPPRVQQVLYERTAGPRAVRLLPSAWAEPPADRPTALPRRPPRNPAGVRTLLLGWHVMPDGRGTRWHTPKELSDAALELFDAAGVETQNLGEVRPWTDRPAA
jgi:hypothetical protein